MSATLTRHKQDLDLAPLLAEGLDEACRDYADLSVVITIPPEDEEDERLGCESIRRQGENFANALARLERLAKETVVDLEGKPFPPPPGVMKSLRQLLSNFALLAEIHTYDELVQQPLVPWDEIRADLERPESREWMKTALAAY